MKMHNAIKRAGLSDIADLVEMMGAAHAEAGFVLNREGAAAAFANLLSDASRGSAWIVFRRETAEGYIVLTFKLGMEGGGIDAFIDDLFVRPGARRSGLGSALVSEAVKVCRQMGAFKLQVEVGANDAAAKGLYSKYGLRDRGHLLLTAALRENPLARPLE
jgi:ribosomal protein S18 acetylase RimI-like enzyme